MLTGAARMRTKVGLAASPGSTTTSAVAAYDVTARPMDGNVNGVAVQTDAGNGLNQNQPFYLVDDC